MCLERVNTQVKKKLSQNLNNDPEIFCLYNFLFYQCPTQVIWDFAEKANQADALDSD